MSWEKPKTDWNVDLVTSGDFNRIEKNISHIGTIQFTGNTTAKIEPLGSGSIIQVNVVKLPPNTRLVLKRAQYFIDSLYNIDVLRLYCVSSTNVFWTLTTVNSEDGHVFNDLNPDAEMAINNTSADVYCYISLRTGTGSGGSINKGSSWQFGLSVEAIPEV